MEPEETVAALKRRDCGNMRREEKGRKHGALVESGGKRRGGEKAWNLGRSTTGLRWGEANPNQWDVRTEPLGGTSGLETPCRQAASTRES